MSRTESLYLRLPAIIQDFLLTYKGQCIIRKRYGSVYKEALFGFKKREHLTENEIKTFQKAKLLTVLENASKTKFYRKIFKQMSANWKELSDPNEFCKIPITYKEDIQNNLDAFRCRHPLQSDRIIKTSGTTGTSLTLPISANVESEQWAVWWRYRSWHGISRKIWCALFASQPIVNYKESERFWRINYFAKEIRFSIYHISIKNVSKYIHALNRLNPPWIHGNPSAISLLASLMLMRGLKLSKPVRWLTVGSENILNWQRQAMFDAFGRYPVQHYGLVEAAANISECEFGNLHTDEDFSYVEYVKNGNGECTIIGTPFVNEAVTILRYHTGDLALPLLGNCPCGRCGRLVRSLDGRTTDYITIPGGKKVASLASPFHSVTGLAEAQLYQDKNGSLTVRYVPGYSWHKRTLNKLEKMLRERVGYSIEIKFQQVERVERTSRGKIKLVLSDYK